MARKAVLAYFADRANDDGTGVWPAKQRVADEIECSKQTVISTVKALLADKLIIEVGQRATTNGYTVEYAIDLVAVASLPDSKMGRGEVQICTGPELDGSNVDTPTGQAALPKLPLNRPIPQKATPSSGKRAPQRAAAIPANFEPIMTGKTAETVDGWPPGRLPDELEHFADYHRANGTTSLDWQASWRTWVRNSKKWEPRNGTRPYHDRPSAWGRSHLPLGAEAASLDEG